MIKRKKRRIKISRMIKVEVNLKVKEKKEVKVLRERIKKEKIMRKVWVTRVEISLILKI